MTTQHHGASIQANKAKVAQLLRYYLKAENNEDRMAEVSEIVDLIFEPISAISAELHTHLEFHRPHPKPVSENPVPFTASQDSISGSIWSVVQGGAVVYEELSREEAEIIADILNENPDLTWEETEPLLQNRLAARHKAENKAQPVDWFAVAASGFQNFEHTISGMQTAALLAIAHELRRMNDRNDRHDDWEDSKAELADSVKLWGN